MKIWNIELAELLMGVLGYNGAPIIMLATIETVEHLISEKNPAEASVADFIYPSTIIGSAAFSTLFMTGIAILAPSKEKDHVRL